MSAYLMGRVMVEVACPPMDMLLLVALADHGADDGTRVYPSVNYLAWKTGLSERFIRERMAGWRESGALEVVNGETGGRGVTVMYRLNIEALPPKEKFSGIPSGAARLKHMRSRSAKRVHAVHPL